MDQPSFLVALYLKELNQSSSFSLQGQGVDWARNRISRTNIVCQDPGIPCHCPFSEQLQWLTPHSQWRWCKSYSDHKRKERIKKEQQCLCAQFVFVCTCADLGLAGFLLIDDQLASSSSCCGSLAAPGATKLNPQETSSLTITAAFVHGL